MNGRIHVNANFDPQEKPRFPPATTSSEAAGEGMSALFQLAYAEIHDLAKRYMQRERAAHTLTPTALVNEAWLRLADSDRNQFENVHHFAATAATIMRRILVNHAKARNAAKRGGGWTATSLDAIADEFSDRAMDLIVLDDALNQLETVDPLQRQLVDLRFFGGLTMEAAATLLGISPRKAWQEWAFAKAWLRREIGNNADDE